MELGEEETEFEVDATRRKRELDLEFEAESEGVKGEVVPPSVAVQTDLEEDCA